MRLFAAILAVSAGFVSSPAAPPVATRAAKIEALRSHTVALVFERDGGSHYIGCAGVWVGPEMILTAAHCTASDKLRGFVTYAEVGTKATVWTQPKGQALHPLVLAAVDEQADLALLLAPGASKHPSAEVGAEPSSGQHVQTVGHGYGVPFGWSPGDVDAVRYDADPDLEPIRGWFTRAVLESRGGNSGGGLWDDGGKLIGITSFSDRAGWTWFVSRGTVAAFLKAHS